MEITIVGATALKMKGKSASLAVNPTAQLTGYNGVLVVGHNPSYTADTDAVVFDGPGEFEVGGIKVTGFRGEPGVAYNVLLDGVSLLIGDAVTLSKSQSKVKEADIVLLEVMTDIDVAFVSAYESRVIIFYGPEAKNALAKLSKENITKTNKFTITKDKLPEEAQFVILE